MSSSYHVIFSALLFFSITVNGQLGLCVDLASCDEESLETHLISIFLQRSDLDLSLTNNEGETVFDLVSDNPAILALFKDYQKRQDMRLHHVAPLPSVKSTAKDRLTFFLTACTLAALAAEFLGGRIRRPL
jgi:hypothetical protein